MNVEVVLDQSQPNFVVELNQNKPNFVVEVNQGVAGIGVPNGGTTGQVLSKNSDADYDTEWVDVSSGNVDSVNGQTGVVVLDSDDISEGSTNFYYTSARSSANEKIVNKSTDGTFATPSNTTYPTTQATKTYVDTGLSFKYNQPTGTTAEYIRGDGSIATFPDSASKLLITVSNQSGVTIPRGSVVYINGAHGNLPTIALAQANNDANSARTVGFVSADIANNATGTVIHTGTVSNLDTQSLTAGVVVYLSPTVAGGYTTTKPSAPDHLVYLGVVTRSHPTQGTIEATIQNGFELEELHNVAIASVANDQVLQYETATSLWKNKTLTKSSVGLGNVDNTNDLNKPISNATQTALNLKADSTDLENYVPYSGATGTVDLGSNRLQAGEIRSASEVFVDGDGVTDGLARTNIAHSSSPSAIEGTTGYLTQGATNRGPVFRNEDSTQIAELDLSSINAPRRYSFQDTDGTVAHLSDIPASLPPSGSAGGDLTGFYPNPTVAANAITNAKAAQMPASTIKGNNTGSTANADDLTVSEVRSMLSIINSDMLYGSGIDGDATISSGTTTLSRNTFYNNLTLSGTGILNTNQNALFVKGTLTLSAAQTGAIQRDGNPGSNAASSTGGTAGALVGFNQRFGSGVAGTAGGNGGTTTGAASGTVTAVTVSPANRGANSGRSGAGGNGPSGSGGISGDATNPLNAYFPRSFIDIVGPPLFIMTGAGTGSYVTASNSGRGGGGGGGDGTNAGGGGGAGGSGAGCVAIYAKTINITRATNTSVIRARGGNGGNGFRPTVGNTGGGGGGGGACGGMVLIVYDEIIGGPISNFIDISGGNGGNGALGNGTGTSGTGGNSGNAGVVILMNAKTGVISVTTDLTITAGSGTTGGVAPVIRVSLG